MPPDDPVEGLTFNEEELADEDIPSEWPPHIREAFWCCTSALSRTLKSKGYSVGQVNRKTLVILGYAK